MKNFLIKLLVVCIFIVSAYMICDLTKYYIEPIHYEKGEMRVVIDDKEVTRSLPQEALIKNNKIMLSFDTIKKYFDPYIYYDEKYNTVIITNETDILKLELDNPTVILNGQSKSISEPAFEKENKIYLPIEDLQDIYDIKVEKNEKIIITTEDINYQTVKMNEKQKVKLFKKELSKTTGKVKEDEILVVFNSKDEKSDYVFARTPNGDLGYILKENINR